MKKTSSSDSVRSRVIAGLSRNIDVSQKLGPLYTRPRDSYNENFISLAKIAPAFLNDNQHPKGQFKGATRLAKIPFPEYLLRPYLIIHFIMIKLL